MRRVAYVSRVKRDFGETELNNIMLQAIANNKRDDVTGMLIYHGDTLFQALEGPEDKVDACYKRIAGDLRHWDIERVYWRNVDTRAFSDWSMGLATPTQFHLSPTITIHSFTEIVARLEAVSDLDISFGKQRLVSSMSDFMESVGLDAPA